MNETNHPMPLQRHFTPKTLNELGLIGSSLNISLSYQETIIAKSGMQKLLSKLPLMDKSPTTSMDLDLSCLLFDINHQFMEAIWYGRLRNDNQSIRHSGDALLGAKNFEQSLISQEEIRLRPDEFDPATHHLIFVLSSHHRQSVHLANKGVVQLSDNENNIADSVALSDLPESQAFILWHLHKHEQDWQVIAPMQPMTTDFVRADGIEQLAWNIKQYLHNASNRW